MVESQQEKIEDPGKKNNKARGEARNIAGVLETDKVTDRD